MAAKFKVGDRVKYRTTRPSHAARHTYGMMTVAKVGFGGEPDLVELIYDDRGGDYSQIARVFDIEHAATLTITVGRYYKNRDGSVVGPMENDDIGFRAYVDGHVRLFAASGEHLFGDSGLDLVEEIPLKIEAGRFYRTRDGRKVGPAIVGGPFNVRSDDDGNTAFAEIGGQGSYSQGGIWLTGGGDCCHDLIAEWTDEPTAKSCAAAEVDNLRDEYGWAAREDKPKFKVGDRVVYDGHTAILREILDGDSYTPYLIEFESDVGYGHNGNNVGKVRLTSNRGWWVDNITAATPTAAPAIVARLDNGQPRPSARPFVHPDRGSAEKEAARLAAANPGKEFAVYEFVSSAKEERRYEHEWQRLAAGGETVDARKALQRAGLTGIQASRIVQEFVAAA